MILTFKTRADVNGNTFYLIANTEEKTFSRHYGMRIENAAVITKKKMRTLINNMLKSGYIEKL